MIIEDYLNQCKETNDRVLNEVEARHITTVELKNIFLDKSDELKVDKTKYNNLLNYIESLFNAVSDTSFKPIIIKHFEELSRLDGNGFESWRNDIKFNNKIEDDLKIIFLCSLYDLELLSWIQNALIKCNPSSRQHTLIALQNYQNVVEGFFSKTINIIIFAMMVPSGNLELTYTGGKGDDIKIKVNSYEKISGMNLHDKLLLLDVKSTSKELIDIAKACNRGLRNAVAHHSFKLNETNQRIIYRVGYRVGHLQFDDFKNQVIELLSSQIILVECFHYYSMDCYFESKKLLK